MHFSNGRRKTFRQFSSQPTSSLVAFLSVCVYYVDEYTKEQCGIIFCAGEELPFPVTHKLKVVVKRSFLFSLVF